MVARHVAINQHRRDHDRAGRRRVIADQDLLHQHAAAVPDHADGVVLRDTLHEALRGLAPRQRTAMLAADAGLTGAEGAALLGVDAGASRPEQPPRPSMRADVPPVAVPGTDLHVHDQPIQDPDHEIGVTAPVPGAPQTVSVTADDDPETAAVNAAACAAARAADPVTFCNR